MSVADQYFKKEANELLTNGFNDEAYEVQFIQVPWDHSYGGNFKYDEEIE